MKKTSLVMICLMALLVIYGFAAMTVCYADNSKPYGSDPIFETEDNSKPYSIGPVVPLDNSKPY